MMARKSASDIQTIKPSDKMSSNIKILIMIAWFHTTSPSKKLESQCHCIRLIWMRIFLLIINCSHQRLLYDYLRVFSSHWENPRMFHAFSFHTLQNINKQSLYVIRNVKIQWLQTLVYVYLHVFLDMRMSAFVSFSLLWIH